MSCFWNEWYNEVPFVFSSSFVLQENGIFEFDFVYFQDQKFWEKDVILEEDFDKLKTYLKNDHFSLQEKIRIFKQCSEHIVLNSSQLGEICELYDD